MTSNLLKVTHSIKKKLDITFNHLDAKDDYTVSLEENSNKVWKVEYNADGEYKHLTGKVSKINQYEQIGPQKEISPGVVDLILKTRSGCKITFDTSDDFKAGSETVDVSNVRAIAESKYVPCPNPGQDVRKPIIVPVEAFNFIQSIYSDAATLTEIPNHLITDKTIDATSMFNGCNALTKIEPLHTRSMTNMNNMFYDCYSLTTIPMMETYKVNAMAGMFANCYALETIPSLDTRNVRTFSHMFKNCGTLIRLPEINMSSAAYADGMFEGCRSLEDVSFTKGSLRIDMDFHDCRLTKEVILNIIKNIGTPLGNKVRHILFDLLPEDKVENVEDYKYVYSVEEYDKFIKPALEAGWIFDGITWDKPVVPELRTDFSRYMAQTYPLTYRDMTFVDLPSTKAATTMQDMFDGCISLLNVPKDFDTSCVLNMSGTFNNCIKIASVPFMDVSKVVNMMGTFFGCNNLVAVPKLHTAKVTCFKNAFANCLKLNTVAELDFTSCVDADSMFTRCPNLEQLFIKPHTLHCSLDVSNTVLNKQSIFSILKATDTINYGNELNFIGVPEASKLTGEEYNTYVKPVIENGWTVKGIAKPVAVKTINFSFYMKNTYPENFMSIIQCPEIPDTTEAVYAVGMFEGCDSLIASAQMYFPKLINADRMFYGCTNILNIFDMRETKKLQSARSMFYACTRMLTSPAINTENVIDFRDMFNSCQMLTVVSELNMEKAEFTDGMFDGCHSLTSVNIKPGTLHASIDFSNTRLTKANLLDIIFNAGFPSAVGNTIRFNNVKAQQEFTEEDIMTYIKPAIDRGWEIECDIPINVIRTDYSWYMKKTLPDVYQTIGVAPEIDIASAKFTDHMYDGCNELTRIPGELDMSNVIHAYGMFKGCSKLTEVHFKADSVHCTLNFEYTAISKANIFELLERVGRPTEANGTLIFNNGTYTLTSDEYNTYVVPAINKGWKIAGIYEPEKLMTDFTDWLVKNYPGTVDTIELVANMPDTSEGTTMVRMFANAPRLKTISATFDTAKCVNMTGMFMNDISLTASPVMDTTNVTNMAHMFDGCTNLVYVQSELNFNGITEETCIDIFKHCFKLQMLAIAPGSLTCDLDLSDTMLDKACILNILKGLMKLPENVTKTITFNDTQFNEQEYSEVERAISKGWTIRGIVKDAGVEYRTDFTNYMRLTYPNTFLTDEVCPEIDTSHATIMQSMFNGCMKLRNVVDLNTSNVTNMNSMFVGCLALKAIPELDMTNVTDTTLMLANCSSLESIKIKAGTLHTNLDLSDCINLDIDAIYNIIDNLAKTEDGLTLTFARKSLNTTDYNNHVLPAINKGWNIVGLVRELRTNFNNYMKDFYTDTYQTLSVVSDLEPTSAAVTMNAMFEGCAKLAVAPSMQTANVYDMTRMFANCGNLTSVQGLSMRSARDVENMFKNCVSLRMLSFAPGSLRISLDLSDCPLTRQVVVNIISNLSTTPETGARIKFFENTKLRQTEWTTYVVAAQLNGWSFEGIDVYAVDPGEDPDEPKQLVYASEIVTDPEHEFISNKEKTEIKETLTTHTEHIESIKTNIKEDEQKLESFLTGHVDDYNQHKEFEKAEAEEQDQIVDTLTWKVLPSAED